MSSEANVDEEASLVVKQEVNSSSYTSFHSSQMYEDGLSFSGNERNKTWINAGAKGFADLSDLSGADSPNDSRAVLAADFDDDGDVDLFVHSIQRERHALYRNDIAAGDFVKLRLRATTSQWEAIGAIVTVTGGGRTTSQILSRGAGFVSCQVPELVFGLGTLASAQVEVFWPGGVSESFGELAAGTRGVLVEGSGEAEPFAAHPRRFADPLPPGLRLDEGDAMPRLHVADENGEVRALDLSTLSDGRTLLVNLWQNTCVGCVKEMPILQKKHETSDEHRIVLLCLDAPAEAENGRRLLERLGITIPCYYRLDTSAPEGAVAITDVIDLDRLKLPTTLILSADGRIDAILQGTLAE